MSIYKKKIKDLIRKAAFKELTEKKISKSKIKDLEYETLAIQIYLKCSKFNNIKRNLLYSLRSRMHPAKIFFRRMHLNNRKCSLGCNANQDQRRIYEKYGVVHTDQNRNVYNYIFEDSAKQKEAISAFIIIEERRRELIQSAVT